MPHIIVKLYPGRSEQQKKKLAEKIMEDVVSIAGCEKGVVSVSFEEVEPGDWADSVYKPDILEKQDSLYIKPDYNPLAD